MIVSTQNKAGATYVVQLSSVQRNHAKNLRMLLAAAVFAAIPTYAQEVRASLAGVVSDPVGAPIPGVTVVLTSVERNVSTTTETNEQGNYLFPFVVSGKYTLTIERAGFKKYSRQNIILQAQDKARADVALEVGDMTQSVSVQADVSQLQTETASRSQIVSNQLIANLPTQGRNPFQIAWAMPGVVKTGDWRYLRAFDTGGMSGFSINGGKRAITKSSSTASATCAATATSSACPPWKPSRSSRSSPTPTTRSTAAPAAASSPSSRSPAATPSTAPPMSTFRPKSSTPTSRN